MERKLFFIIAGYLSGSVLYGRIFGKLLRNVDITEDTKDGNPGTANAFLKGGFFCGALTLIGDILKGFLPVYLYLRGEPSFIYGTALAFVLLAPVLGHVFPVFYGFQGGKGIAVSFGCLLGLFPVMEPALLLAFSFLFFSLVLRVTPHYHRTIWTYVNTFLLMVLFVPIKEVRFGFLMIAALVILRLWHSEEERERLKVRLLWMH